MLPKGISLFTLLMAIPAAVHAGSIQLPRTGQTDCWDELGNVVSCAGTGQDGDLLKGIPWPSPRFLDNLDGTLTDNLTGLVWLQNADCFGEVPWQQALNHAKSLKDGDCGLADGSLSGHWRLPNRKELQSILDQNASDGGVALTNQGFINGKHDYFWTSDTCLDYERAYKWIVSSYGAVYPDSWNSPYFNRLVMLVRNPRVSITAALTGGHGVLSSPNPMSVPKGASVSFTLVPDAGYQPHLDSGTCPPGSFTGNSYSIDAVDADCAVDFSFAQVGYTIASATYGLGVIECTPAGPVTYGTPVSCKAIPAIGNHVTGVTVDDVVQTVADPAGFTYDFPGVTSSHSISASFEANSYTIDSFTSGPGSIECIPSGPVTYETPVSCKATPELGNHVTGVTVDGVAQTVADPAGFTYDFPGVTGNHSISASFEINSYTIVSATTGSGAIECTPPGAVPFNSPVSCAVTPAVGNHIARVTVDDVAQAVADPTGYRYDFPGVTTGHSISSDFEINSYTVTFATSSNGTVTGSTPQTVTYGGSTAEVLAVPDAGYHFVNWSGDNGFATTANPLVLADVKANQAVTANFGVNSYVITPGGSANGSITPATPQTVNYNEKASFTVAPDAGYRIDAVTGCGGVLDGLRYTTASVSSDCSVSATFAQITYAVSVTAMDDKGAISCTPKVNWGGAALCSIKPKPGYSIATLSDNNTDCLPLISNDSYSISNVTGDHVVAGSFTANTYEIGDILRAYRSFLGQGELSGTEKSLYDVAPLDAGGRPQPDGTVDVADVIILLRKFVGAVSW